LVVGRIKVGQCVCVSIKELLVVHVAELDVDKVKCLDTGLCEPNPTEPARHTPREASAVDHEELGRSFNVRTIVHCALGIQVGVLCDRQICPDER